MSNEDIVVCIAIGLFALAAFTVYAHRRWNRPTTKQAVVSWSIVVACCALAVVAAGIYSGLTPSAEPVLRELQAAPVPGGGRAVDTETQRGNIDSSPQAWIQYALSDSPGTDCFEVIQGYLDHGYKLDPDDLDAGEPQDDPVTSADKFCDRTSFAAPDAEQIANNSITGADLDVCKKTGDHSCFEAILTLPDPLHYPQATAAHAKGVLALSSS